MMISLTRCRPVLHQYRMLLLWNINQQIVKTSHQGYQPSNQNLLKRRRKLLHLLKVRYEKIRHQCIVSTDFVQIIIVEKKNTHVQACWFSVPTCFSSCLKFFPLGYPFFSISCRKWVFEYLLIIFNLCDQNNWLSNSPAADCANYRFASGIVKLQLTKLTKTYPK